MFVRLFSNWSNPALVAALVGARTLSNAVLTVTASGSSFRGARATVVAAGLTALSAVLSVAVLRGDVGLGASYLEFLVQIALLAFVGYVVRSNPSSDRVKAATIAALCAVALLLCTIPLYGEATVAP